MRKLIIALLLLNFVATLTVGYMFYEKSQQDIELTIEVPDLKEQREFRKNGYQGMVRVLENQRLNFLRILSLHHFLEPHENGEYESCPECQKHLQENQDKIISNVYIKEQTL
jgi:hypothetical protein|tara:strand:+ start:873 stop:1208 length:336 start_codon:yes stop_codon:yes gene_type:complete